MFKLKRKIIAGVICTLVLALFLPLALLGFDGGDSPKLIIFHSLSCHKCIVAKQETMPVIENEFKGRIIFEYRDVGELENYKMLLGLLQQSGSKLNFQVPLFYLGGKFLSAEGKVEDNLRNFLVQGLKQGQLGSAATSVNLSAYFKSFVPAAIAFAGLSDGINPCAFTVIVFFISFLALQGYRRRELIFIGSAFILAVFLTYLGIGLGIFNLFYRMKSFGIVISYLNSIIGSLSILFGFFAIYDFIKFKQTGSAEGLVLQLPKSIKEQIHKVVGFFYRKNTREKQDKVNPRLGKLILSALISGFLISLLEAVCTGQVYLPTISFILKSGTYKFQAWGYLLLYNVMFIIPLVVIFIFALLGTTSSQFSVFLKKHLGLIKILMAVLFFSLGVFLIWRV